MTVSRLGHNNVQLQSKEEEETSQGGSQSQSRRSRKTGSQDARTNPSDKLVDDCSTAGQQLQQLDTSWTPTVSDFGFKISIIIIIIIIITFTLQDTLTHTHTVYYNTNELTF